VTTSTGRQQDAMTRVLAVACGPQRCSRRQYTSIIVASVFLVLFASTVYGKGSSSSGSGSSSGSSGGSGGFSWGSSAKHVSSRLGFGQDSYNFRSVDTRCCRFPHTFRVQGTSVSSYKSSSTWTKSKPGTWGGSSVYTNSGRPYSSRPRYYGRGSSHHSRSLSPFFLCHYCPHWLGWHVSCCSLTVYEPAVRWSFPDVKSASAMNCERL